MGGDNDRGEGVIGCDRKRHVVSYRGCNEYTVVMSQKNPKLY